MTISSGTFSPMPIDPTGYAGALEAIQPGQLSERQQRIATALAMVRDGTPLRKAAVVAKVPYATLWEYHNKGRSVAGQETKADYNIAAVTEVSVDISLMAAERVRDRLAENPDDWSNMDLVKAYGVATDKIIALAQRTGGQSAEGMTELQRLLTGRKVTIEDAQPIDSAIEVEAVEP